MMRLPEVTHVLETGTTLLIYADRPLIVVLFAHCRPRRIRFSIFSLTKISKNGVKSI